MDRFSIILLLVIAYCNGTMSEDISAEQMKEFYRNSLDPSSYDKRIRPNQGVKAVDVSASMYIINVYDYCPKNSMIKVDFYFRQNWTDTRLAHAGGDLVGGSELMKQIWTPDTFFPSAVGGKIADTTVPNAFVKISNEGSVMVSVRTTENVFCAPSLRVFPVDNVICPLYIESYGYSMKDIVYKWKNDKVVGISDNIQIEQFKLVSLRQGEHQETLSMGTYSRLEVQLIFARRACGYVTKYFLPLIIVTSLSFATFCLQPSCIRSAVTLGSGLLTPLLVVLMNRAAPVSGFSTSFDVFGLICIIFTVLSLLHEVRQQRAIHCPASEKPVENGDVGAEFHQTQTLRNRLCHKAVPITYAAFLFVYAITMTIFKNSV